MRSGVRLFRFVEERLEDIRQIRCLEQDPLHRNAGSKCPALFTSIGDLAVEHGTGNLEFDEHACLDIRGKQRTDPRHGEIHESSRRRLRVAIESSHAD